MGIVSDEELTEHMVPWKAQGLLGRLRREKGVHEAVEMPWADSFKNTWVVQGAKNFYRDFYLGGMDRPPVEFGYNAAREDEDIVFSDPEFVDAYLRSESRAETRQIFQEIQERKLARARVGRMGWRGMLTDGVAALADPTILLPAGGFVKSAKLVRALTKGSRLARIGVGAAEGAALNFLHEGLVLELENATGHGVPEEEVHDRLMMSLYFGGFFGGLGGALIPNGAKGAVADILNPEFRMPDLDKHFSPEVLRAMSPDERVQKVIQLIDNENAGIGSVIKLPQSRARRWLRKTVGRLTPNLRLHTSANPMVRTLGRLLTDQSLSTDLGIKLGDDVVTSVESAVKLRLARNALLQMETRDVWLNFKERGGSMPRRTFNQEVGRALRRGDRARDVVTDPLEREFIEDVAARVRGYLDQVGDKAVELGFLRDLGLRDTAESYFPRIYSAGKIRADERGDRLFRKKLIEHYKDRGLSQEEAAEVASRNIDTILKEGGEAPGLSKVGEAPAFRDRQILIPDDEIEEFLENDIGNVLTRFGYEVEPQLAFAERFSTGRQSLKVLSDDLEAAVARVESGKGDLAEVQHIREDLLAERSAIAWERQMNTEGLAKAAEIRGMVKDRRATRHTMEQKRQTHRQLRVQEDAYDNARVASEAVEGEAGFRPNWRRRVRSTFTDELQEKKPRANPDSQLARKQEFAVLQRALKGQEETLYPKTRARLEDELVGVEKTKLGSEYLATMRDLRDLGPEVATWRKTSATLSAHIDSLGATEHRLSTRLRNERELINADARFTTKIALDPKKIDKDSFLVKAAREEMDEARLEVAMRGVELTDYTDRLARDRHAAPAELKGELQNELHDVQAIRDDLLHRGYRFGSDPMNVAFTMERGLMRTNFVTKMGPIMLNSMADLGNSFVVNGFLPTIRAFRNNMRPAFRAFLNDVSKVADQDEIMGLVSALELVHNHRFRYMTDLLEDAPLNRVDAASGAMADAFAKASLINNWNGTVKAVAAAAVMNKMTPAIRSLAAGTKLSTRKRAMLQKAGINKRVAKIITKQFREHSEKLKGDGITWRTQRWGKGLDGDELKEVLEAKRTVQQAVISEVDRTIITPSVGDAPRWFRKPFARLMVQFQRFHVSATQRFLASNLQHADLKTILSFVFPVTAGAMVYGLSEISKGRNPLEADAGAWTQNAIDRSGVLGYLSTIDAGIERMTDGQVGMSRLFGAETTRFTDRRAWEAFVGASAGTVTDLSSFARAVLSGDMFTGDMPKKELRAIRRLLPGNNLFYLRWKLDKLVETMADVWGLPEDQGGRPSG